MLTTTKYYMDGSRKKGLQQPVPCCRCYSNIYFNKCQVTWPIKLYCYLNFYNKGCYDFNKIEARVNQTNN